MSKDSHEASAGVLERGRRTVIDFDSEAVARIMDAAEAIFAEKSFAGARMDDIAALAGLNKASIYYHIGNKEKLYQEILKRHFSRFADRLEKELANCDDPIEGLCGVVRIHAEEFGRNLASTRTIAHEIADGLSRTSPEARAIVQRVVGVTARFLDRAAERGVLPPLNPVVVHHILVGPLQMNALVVPVTAESARSHPGGSHAATNLTAMGELIAQIVLPGLAARRNEPI